MNFDHFLNLVDQIQSSDLGGQTVQFKLAPALRLQYDEDKIKARNPKSAAVLALFYPNKENQTTVLLTKRASYNGTHSAQISFPGGKIEKRDSNLQQTALRETYEEIGIFSKDIFMIRELTDVYIPPSNFLVTPFMGYCKNTPDFKMNHEVASLVEVPLKDLLDERNIDTVEITTSYMKLMPVPCFKLNDNIVWGATGMMLSEIKELIKSL